jgi:hypothetical protein
MFYRRHPPKMMETTSGEPVAHTRHASTGLACPGEERVIVKPRGSQSRALLMQEA